MPISFRKISFKNLLPIDEDKYYNISKNLAKRIMDALKKYKSPEEMIDNEDIYEKVKETKIFDDDEKYKGEEYREIDLKIKIVKGKKDADAVIGPAKTMRFENKNYLEILIFFNYGLKEIAYKNENSFYILIKSLLVHEVTHVRDFIHEKYEDMLDKNNKKYFNSTLEKKAFSRQIYDYIKDILKLSNKKFIDMEKGEGENFIRKTIFDFMEEKHLKMKTVSDILMTVKRELMKNNL